MCDWFSWRTTFSLSLMSAIAQLLVYLTIKRFAAPQYRASRILNCFIRELAIYLWPRSFCWHDIMAEHENAMDGDIACGDALSWKDRKRNIALITGITGQVSTFIGFGCHNRYCSLLAIFPVITGTSRLQATRELKHHRLPESQFCRTSCFARWVMYLLSAYLMHLFLFLQDGSYLAEFLLSKGYEVLRFILVVDHFHF